MDRMKALLPSPPVIRAATRMALLLYPHGFQAAHQTAFFDHVDDRWARERSQHHAAASFIRVVVWLITDTVQGRRAIARRRPPVSRSLMIDRFLAHLRFAIRQLKRAPLVAAVATLSLAVGIGANTAVFTIANGLFFAPLAGVANPAQVIDIGRTTNGTGFDTTSFPLYQDVRARATTLDGVFAMRGEPRALSVGAADGADRAFGLDVSASYFDVLGTKMVLGSAFHGTEEHVGERLRRVVLSDAFWRRHFAADRSIVGQPIVLNGDTFTIAGVTEPGFHGTTFMNPDMWVPLTADATSTASRSMLQSRESAWILMGGRLKPGRTLAEARAELSAINGSLAAAYPDVYTAPGRVLGLTAAPVSRLPGEFGAFVRPFIAILAALVGLVLLIACANLSGLLLARAAGRSREVAVRLALGGSRWSLASMFLVETLVLFLPGAAAGVLIASSTSRALAALGGVMPVPVLTETPIDWRVLAYSVIVTLAASLVTGLAPALHGSRADLVSDLKSDASAPRRQRLRRIFVAAEMALCSVLLVAGALFVRALDHSSRLDGGFQTARVDVVDVDLALAGYPEDRQLAVTDDLRTRFLAVPGVECVSASAIVPLVGDGLGLGNLRRAGDPESMKLLKADWNVVTPDFLPELGVPLVEGREFAETDRKDAPFVAIVNEQFARTFWPDTNPVGQRLEYGDFRPGPNQFIHPMTVVGVVRGTMARAIGGDPRPFIYVPVAQHPLSKLHFFVQRAPAAADVAMLPALRSAMRDFNRNLPIAEFAPFSRYAEIGLLPLRIAGSIAVGLALLALLLAAMGLYGVTSFAVTSRTREIGVRIALGADRPRIAKLVLTQGLRLVVIGGAMGALLAAGCSQLLSSLLFDISPLDPAAFGGTIVLLALVALAATWIPARRAAALDPSTALRDS
jgi:predicted permease